MVFADTVPGCVWDLHWRSVVGSGRTASAPPRSTQGPQDLSTSSPPLFTKGLSLQPLSTHISTAGLSELEDEALTRSITESLKLSKAKRKASGQAISLPGFSSSPLSRLEARQSPAPQWNLASMTPDRSSVLLQQYSMPLLHPDTLKEMNPTIDEPAPEVHDKGVFVGAHKVDTPRLSQTRMSSTDKTIWFGPGLLHAENHAMQAAKEIAELAQLLDRGLLLQEEFILLKKQVMLRAVGFCSPNSPAIDAGDKLLIEEQPYPAGGDTASASKQQPCISAYTQEPKDAEAGAIILAATRAHRREMDQDQRLGDSLMSLLHGEKTLSLLEREDLIFGEVTPDYHLEGVITQSVAIPPQAAALPERAEQAANCGKVRGEDLKATHEIGVSDNDAKAEYAARLLRILGESAG